MAENNSPVPDGITSTDAVVVAGEPGLWVAKRGGGFKKFDQPVHQPEDGEPVLNAHVASGPPPSTPEEVREAVTTVAEGSTS